MIRETNPPVSRRRFMQTAAAVSAGLWAAPYPVRGGAGAAKPMKRDLGRLQFEATTLGLGGQASIQWTRQAPSPCS